MAISGKSENILLYVKDKGRVRGPFLRDFIDAMSLSGHFSTTIEVSLNGQNDWTRIALPTAPTPAFSSGSNTASSPSGSNKRNIVLGILGAAGLGIVWLLAAGKATPSRPSNRTIATRATTYSTPAPVSKSTPKPVTTPIFPVHDSTPSPVVQSTPRTTYTPPPIHNSSRSQGSYNDPSESAYSYRQSQGYNLKRLEQVVREKKQIVASLKQSMDTIDAQIKVDRPYLDHNSQKSIDKYNYKIDRFNELRLQYNSAVGDLNGSVNQFNAELQRIGTPSRK